MNFRDGKAAGFADTQIMSLILSLANGRLLFSLISCFFGFGIALFLLGGLWHGSIAFHGPAFSALLSDTKSEFLSLAQPTQ